MLQKKLKLGRFATILLAMTWTLVLMTGCMMSDFETLHPPNCAGSFDLPKPVEQPVMDGSKQYVAKQGKVGIWVGVYPLVAAGLPETAQPGEMLRALEEKRLYGEPGKDGIVTTLKNQGMNPQVHFEGDLKTERSIGQQIRIVVGDQFVLTRSYAAPDALYFFKIDNGDENNEMVKKVLDSINP